MPEENQSHDDIVSLLKRQRDELKLKIHLGGKDAQDKWDELETEWNGFREAVEPLSEAVKDAASKAGEQASKVAEDVPPKLKDGYEKLRKMLE